MLSKVGVISCWNIKKMQKTQKLTAEPARQKKEQCQKDLANGLATVSGD